MFYNQIAHVIIVSDNRENLKRVAKGGTRATGLLVTNALHVFYLFSSYLFFFIALPSRPLASIALTDADSESALKFVSWKLAEAGLSESLSSDQVKLVERLGGRASDLETVSHRSLYTSH